MTKPRAERRAARTSRVTAVFDPGTVEAELRKGARRARELATPYLAEIREAIGIRRLG